MVASHVTHSPDLVAALDLVRRFVGQCHPSADDALLAGSRARGTARSNSDYDVVLLFSSLPEGAWREVVTFEGRTLEVFGHDLGTFSYFCRELDRPSGKPVLPTLVVEGIPVLPLSPTLENARAIAKKAIAEGPPPLTEAAIRHRRYVITDLVMALNFDDSRHELLAVGVALYSELADFVLRSRGFWGASGKALPRALAANLPAFSRPFETAFEELFIARNVGAVEALVDDVLHPFGGRLREGYRQTAPREWTDNE